MAERTPPSYPPVGQPERFDQIVARGRSMRRRRQLGLGAGIGGTAVAIVAAVALVSGSGPSTERIVVDQADDPTPTSQVTTTSTVTTTPPAPGGMTVQVAVGSPTLIVVDDPEQVIDAGSRQCLLVTLRDVDATETAVAEGYACDDSAADNASTVPVDVVSTGGVQIGCAATATRVESTTTDTAGTRRVRTTFQLLTDDVPGGTYELTVSATSGVGDGCALEGSDPNEQEGSAGADATLTLP